MEEGEGESEGVGEGGREAGGGRRREVSKETGQTAEARGGRGG